MLQKGLSLYAAWCKTVFLEESAFDLPRIFLLLKCSYPMLLTFLGCLYTWPCTVGLERGGKAMSFLHKVCMVCGKWFGVAHPTRALYHNCEYLRTWVKSRGAMKPIHLVFVFQIKPSDWTPCLRHLSRLSVCVLASLYWLHSVCRIQDSGIFFYWHRII